MTNYDPSTEPPRDPRVPPGSANQTVARSQGNGTLVIAAVVVAILVILFLVFGGGSMFSGGDKAVTPADRTDTTIVPETTAPSTPAITTTPSTPAPEPAPAPSTSPATPPATPSAPSGSSTTTPAPAQ